MSTTRNVKILAFGSVNGKIEQAFAKAKLIDTQHGPFDVLICLGSFFGKTESDQVVKLLNGEIEVPLRTYFLLGQDPLPAMISEKTEREQDICSNLFYLGKSGILTTTPGVRIAFLGGIYDPDAYEATVDDDASMCRSPFINRKDTTIFDSSGDKDIDILLTNEWPADVCQLSSQSRPADISECIPVQQVAHLLRPRYHFAAGPFFEREPFRNDKGKDQVDPQVTRFISLANFANVDKQRWFYAFNIPISKYSIQTVNAIPVKTTNNPYEWSINQRNILKRPAENTNVEDNDIDSKRLKSNKHRPPETYLCKQCENPGHWLEECEFVPEGYACRYCQGKHRPKHCPVKPEDRERNNNIPPDTYICNACGKKADHYIRECPEKKTRERTKRKPIGPEACFFCLSNPKLEKHLVVSIGEESYVALAKGPLSSPSTNPPSLPFSGHALIIPIPHTPNIFSIPKESRLGTVNELAKYRDAINKMYEEAGCAAVSIEISRTHAVHAHWQIHPIAKPNIQGLEEAFQQAAKTEGFEFHKEDISGEIVDYIRVYLPDGVLSHIIPPHSRFDLQFGRKVLCNHLGFPERVDWRACTQTEEEEKIEAAQFKMAFKPFDFS
ncbi:CWF19-like protein mug161 [Neolecta irregularis DAH-3]|uniref:CWF19-like protein mug161 n=1 Tax=Neolecta irregularis (strain DAH-3) TaxID=1198029 RepID=A0A1U7LJ62_NEOID|nr:CWF19-like protein mug161 [Neolecta irregularis DAH-3]|eukprot:OLL22633.1 CWF19-like protein mug161 [Neolecta irregularis DAH-3]